MRHTLSLATVLVAFTAPTVALAESTPPDPGLQSALVGALVTLIPVIATGLAGLLGAVFLALRKKLNAEADNSKVTQVGNSILIQAEAIVRDLQVTMRPKLEAASSDGKLTDAELSLLKAEALARLKTSLGDSGIKLLQEVFGIAAGSVGSFLSGIVEVALDRMKASRPPPTTVVQNITAAPALPAGEIGAAAALTAVPTTPHG